MQYVWACELQIRLSRSCCGATASVERKQARVEDPGLMHMQGGGSLGADTSRLAMAAKWSCQLGARMLRRMAWLRSWRLLPRAGADRHALLKICYQTCMPPVQGLVSSAWVP
ncbi:hypothetical protein ABPG75_008566 [Micractinium tetrahymenae]